VRHRKNSFFKEPSEELSARHKLHDEVELLLRLEGVGQAHQERVPEVGHDEPLRPHILKLLLTLGQGPLVNHLKEEAQDDVENLLIKKQVEQ